jgi:hypothetical protein
VKEREDAENGAKAARARLEELSAQMAQAKETLAKAMKADKFTGEQLGAGKGYESPATAQLREQIKLINGQMQAIYSSLNELPSQIEGISNKAYEQAVAVDAAMQAADIKIAEIESKFQLTEKAQQFTQATAEMETLVKSLADNVGRLEPINEAQRQAKDLILEAVQGGISPEEQTRINMALRTVMSTLQANQGVTLQTMQDLIAANTGYGDQIKSLQREVAMLKQRALTSQPMR